MKENNIDLVKITTCCTFYPPTEEVCLVVDSSFGGSLQTLCGEYVNCEYEDDIKDDFATFSEKIKGNLKNITCPKCLKILEYIKSLK